MKPGFTPIRIEKYVELHLRSNPGVKRADLVARLQRAIEAARRGVRCQCGAPIWIIGSAEAGLACFTCITGQSEPDHDYEIDLGAGRTQAAPQQRSSSRFCFEPGSYGAAGGGFLPSALCYEQVAPDQWKEHFCLVNPMRALATEQAACAQATADLNEASAARSGVEAGGFARVLKAKGYVSVEDFQRASD